MKCKSCGAPLNLRNKTGYCRRCSSKRPEIRAKNSAGVKRFHEGGNGYKLTVEDAKASRDAYKRNRASEIEKNPSGFFSGARLTNFLLVKGFPYCCAECGISEWRGKSFTLEVDHADGNKRNNTLENLRFLCPNCHSQTDTYKGKNIKKGKSKEEILKKVVPDETLLAAYNETGNIRQTLLKVGLDPQGANYNRVYELITKNTAP